jgi:hypothetical protein
MEQTTIRRLFPLSPGLLGSQIFDESWIFVGPVFPALPLEWSHENGSGTGAVRCRNPRSGLCGTGRQYTGAQRLAHRHRQCQRRPPAEWSRATGSCHHRRAEDHTTGNRGGGRCAEGGHPDEIQPCKVRPCESGAAAANAAKPNPAKSAPVTAPANTGGSAAAPSSSGSGSGTNGGAVTVQPVPVPGGVVPVESGDDKGGLRKAPEPGDDSGGHGADD